MKINKDCFVTPNPGEEIVISGLSGAYPKSANVDEFRDNIFNQVDLISNCRWNTESGEVPNKSGLISDIDKFDASFFGFHCRQAHSSDCMLRIMLEKSFEAVVDAGLNPKELEGTRTGVFIACCFSESEMAWLNGRTDIPGYPVTGCIRSLIANRVSYWLNVNGPSYTADTACSSSLFTLDKAYRSLKNNECDSAIVGGCQVCLSPQITLQFARLGVLNKDGKCKCFDENADGYTRSEGIVALLLQKSKDARRTYAQIVHGKANCDGFKNEGITFPSRFRQSLIIHDVYSECGIDPSDVEYVEAHATSTRVGDPEEIAAISSVFCTDGRKTPLLVNSVKSNVGHCEAAAGLCSITKVLLTMETGYHAPIANYRNPRQDMTAIHSGQIKIVTDKIKYNDGYVGVNNFGFGGSNCHVVLKPFARSKTLQKKLYVDNMPRIINISGRTKEAVTSAINDVTNKVFDVEFIALLHKVFRYWFMFKIFDFS